MTTQEIQAQLEREARMEVLRKSFTANWPELHHTLCQRGPIAKLPLPELHQAAWTIWLKAKNSP